MLLSYFIEKEGIFIKNKYENMDIVSFEDFDCLYDAIGNKLFEEELDENDYIVVYAKRYFINELFTRMIKDDYSFGYVDLDMMDNMFNDMTYMIFIRGNCVISVEPAYTKNGKVMGHDAKYAIISMDDCKQDIIDYCVNHDMDVTLYDFAVEDYCDCDGGNCDCKDLDTDSSEHTHISREKDGKIAGFSKTWHDSDEYGNSYYSSYSHYSNDEDGLKEIMKRFGIL